MDTLPRIACFHGGGSTASIYEIQCSTLAQRLQNHFELVYFEGPFIRNAGPGVLPAFADHGPYKSWFTHDADGHERDDGSGSGAGAQDGVERVWRLMETAGPGGEWVGAMGFSQGSRVVGGLLLDQQRRERLGQTGTTRIRLRFGVCCMGAGAPMQSRIAQELDVKDRASERVRIPTLHVHGLKDMFLPLGRQQYENYYERATATLYEVNYHHAMPWYKHEVEKLAELIQKIDLETRVV
ncbi:conserved hypothetical protein [Aspergillus terreus NIH2624]|uniref:Serine hydrolase domain-containing protein n=1 Tax=Aspergillus terreus (strain NIH 2624 / FGSC A1156) TaxID=341663 RepID=Q0CCD6_ASPTN|nr:uncharacterized protein ATEG_08648 [Aspergillus terreus NIH2624]EAU30780.1 conserved hypothetical protein [Aspergillus terreus NIH2624]